jgi:methylenetetrahydrofolate reductase (NADPH)
VCGTVRRAGFEPVAHVPVRLLESAEAFKRLLEQLRKGADAREILLISGDYAQAAGPYHATSQALATGMLEDCGFSRVSVAGHPEGHPRVSLGEIRYAEWEKAQLALRHELEVTLVTQFLFEPAPFLSWANDHRSRGLATRYVCGLSGPARISTLLRYAMRCGVGPSVKALGAHHTSITNLLAEHGPDRMLRKLAEARLIDSGAVGGVHLFCFGGFIRTAQWLSRVAAGDFRLQSAGGFDA